jgi:hypothetical protein
MEHPCLDLTIKQKRNKPDLISAAPAASGDGRYPGIRVFALASGSGMVQVKLIKTPYVRRKKPTSISGFIRRSEASAGFRRDMPGQVFMEHQ